MADDTRLTEEVLKAIGVDPEDVGDVLEALLKQKIRTVGGLRNLYGPLKHNEKTFRMFSSIDIAQGPAAAILRFVHGKHLRWIESQKLRMGLKLLH